MLKKINEIYQDKLIECTEYIQKEYSRCCRPIYGILDDGTVEHLGSSVLLNCDGRRYIITASHVVDEHQNATLAILIDGELRILEGDFYQTAKVNGNRDLDRHDFAWRDISDNVLDISCNNFYSETYML